MEKGDVTVILLILIVFVGFITLRFRHWLATPPKKRLSIYSGSEVPDDDDTVRLLEGAGFDVLSGKTKVPITMMLNDSEEFQTRLYIDYFAQKNEELFLVKVARERKPLEMTGSSIRDHLLSYSLLYPEAAGVLYVDMEMLKIKKITFHIEV
ncbi:hypothetical protein [Paenibacillus eucommiae]|uniref:Uncharacterized protein n=1 Tax=Paenibacillus eucommiae TaxID=1355755 RepID=A0ABS4IN81_9BACL|nr:hypothetical protein [Paenibacillus eucommiae]MBP1989032.1 hypothetical protein [Paenibacillus eucommiae]